MLWRYDELMSSVAETRTHGASMPWRFTRAQFERMGEVGVFEGKRVELLDGEVIAMTPQGSLHAASVARIVRILTTTYGSRASIRPQLPLALDDANEPEPDIAVCRPDPRDYADGHPGPSDVLLIIEVADTSLAYDRGPKAAAYARLGIPLLWIVNVVERFLESHKDPEPGTSRYRHYERLAENEAVTLPGATSIAVSTLLPPR
jgi:Uma2 family endonuclease